MMSERVRLAFTIGYIGRHFHGSQIQPDVRTVQGELIKAFTKLKWLSKDAGHNLVLSSRTDAGVNVRRNGGAVTIDRSLWQSLGRRKMIRAVDDRLPNEIGFLNVHEVSDDWNPRLASQRVYRYRLEGIQGWNYPGEIFQDWLSLFVGTYNATNFAKLEEGKNPIRKIYACQPWKVDGRVVGFEITGEAFLWNQVRRTAMALYGLSTGELNQQQIIDAINQPGIPVDFGVAPPEWLVLWDVIWPDFEHPNSEETLVSFTPPPSGEYLERTMMSRWEAGCKLEMESMILHEWSMIGRLPYAPHKS